jgi:hypothetical protein
MTIEILIKLLVINIVAKSLLGFSIRFRILSEDRLLSCLISSIILRSSEKYATSDPLIKPEIIMSRISKKTVDGTENTLRNTAKNNNNA